MLTVMTIGFGTICQKSWTFIAVQVAVSADVGIVPPLVLPVPVVLIAPKCTGRSDSESSGSELPGLVQLSQANWSWNSTQSNISHNVNPHVHISSWVI